MKKKILIGCGIVFCILLLLFVFVFKKSSGVDNEVPVPEPVIITERPIEESIGERPYVSLVPTADGHWVNLEIKNFAKGVRSFEYDLIYFADFEGSKIERGVTTGGVPVELSGSDFSKKILFGSASCTTGVCKYKYDENVTEGSLILNINLDKEVDHYETTYRIQKGSEGKEGLTTGDGAFSFVSSNLKTKNLYLTISSVGVPVMLPVELVPKSVPYAIFPTITEKGTVTVKTPLSSGAIYAFNGKSWQKLPTTFSEGEATAQSSGNYLFILTQ